MNRYLTKKSISGNSLATDNLLVIAPAWVGDFIMAQSLFQIVKKRDPNIAIDIVAPPWTAPLAARMPEIRDTFVLSLGHGILGLSTRWRMGSQLRERRYQQAIILPSSFKSALVPFAARIKQRTGYLGEMRWGLLNDIRPSLTGRTVDRFMALGQPYKTPLPDPLPIPRLMAHLNNASATLAKFNISLPAGPVLALCPGAEYGPAKRWPVGHFAEVARKVIAIGWQVWLFGSQRDAAISAAIQRRTGNTAIINFAGRTSLTEAVDILALATAVVTNDSGLMHIAAALDRPLVALFGSSDPRHTPPLSIHATILSRSLPCSPCFQRTCPLHHLNCLQELTPADVIAALPNKI